MRRTGSRPSSGERSHTPPSGESNGGEGRESFSANAQHDGAASSNAIAYLANALWQALQMTNEGGPTGSTGTYASRPIEIRQKVMPVPLVAMSSREAVRVLVEVAVMSVELSAYDDAVRGVVA